MMPEDSTNIDASTLARQRLDKKITLYHEAAHAVFMWNFGFEVERVMVGQSGLSGHVAPASYWSNGCATSKRIALILSGLAGGVAHRCFQTGDEKDKLLCSSGDMSIILNLIAMLGVTSKVAGLYILRVMVQRTIQLIDGAEVQAQIQELVRVLRPRSCLLKRQVHVHLKSLPASRAAIKKSMAVVMEIDAGLAALLERATQEAREMGEHPYYTSMAAMYDLAGVSTFVDP